MAYETSKIAGDMMIFIGTGVAKYPIAFSKSASLDTGAAIIGNSTKDAGGWESNRSGRKNWSASTDVLYTYTMTSGTTSQDSGEIYALYVAGTELDFAFASATGTFPTNSYTINAANKVYTGKCLIESLSISSSDGEDTTFSIKLKGTGALVLV